MKRGFFNGFTDYWSARACVQNDRGASTWLTIDASGATAYIVPLTVGCFNELVNVGSSVLFQRVYVIPVCTDVQYLSDVVRGIDALREIKPSVKLVFPTRIPLKAGTVQQVAWANAEMECTTKFVNRIGEYDKFFNPNTDIFVCEFLPIKSYDDRMFFALKMTCNDYTNTIYPFIPKEMIRDVLESLHKIHKWDAMAVPYNRGCFGGVGAREILQVADTSDVPPGNPDNFYHFNQLCGFDYSCDTEYQEMVHEGRLTVPGRLYIGHRMG